MTHQNELDDLRLKAFKSGSQADKASYHERLSLAFQRGEIVPIQKVSDTLKVHWITNIICDEATHTDRVGCWCGEWYCEPQPTIALAVHRWIEHVIEQLA